MREVMPVLVYGVQLGGLARAEGVHVLEPEQRGGESVVVEVQDPLPLLKRSTLGHPNGAPPIGWRVQRTTSRHPEPSTSGVRG